MIVDFSVKVVGYGISIFGQTSHAGEFVLFIQFVNKQPPFQIRWLFRYIGVFFNQKGI